MYMGKNSNNTEPNMSPVREKSTKYPRANIILFTAQPLKLITIEEMKCPCIKLTLHVMRLKQNELIDWFPKAIIDKVL